MNTRGLFLAALAILVAATAGFLWIYARSSTPAPAAAQRTIESTRRAQTSALPPQAPFVSDPATRTVNLFLQVFAPEPIGEVLPSIQDTRSFLAIQPVLSLLAAEFPAVIPAPAPPPLTATITPEEVFRLLYPDFYLSTLRAAQDFLVGEGVIQPGATFSFKNEGELRAFDAILIQYLLDTGIIDRRGYEADFNGSRFLYDAPYEFKVREALAIQALQHAPLVGPPDITPAAARQEFRELLKSQGYDPDALGVDALSPVSFLGEPSLRRSARQVLSRHLTRFVQALANLLPIQPINTAEAAAKCVCTCSRPNICYGEGKAGPLGRNVKKPCCVASACCAWLGCWNTCDPKPFIWDPETNICGC